MLKKISVLLSVLIFIILILVIGIKIPCPFYILTGLHCPGCGITRCILSILKLDFYAAFRYNPLVFILLPFIFVYVIYKIYTWLFNKKDKLTYKLEGYPVYILVIILIIYGILRNTSLFSWLAPTVIH